MARLDRLHYLIPIPDHIKDLFRGEVLHRYPFAGFRVDPPDVHGLGMDKIRASGIRICRLEDVLGVLPVVVTGIPQFTVWALLSFHVYHRSLFQSTSYAF